MYKRHPKIITINILLALILSLGYNEYYPKYYLLNYKFSLDGNNQFDERIDPYIAPIAEIIISEINNKNINICSEKIGYKFNLVGDYINIRVVMDSTLLEEECIKPMLISIASKMNEILQVKLSVTKKEIDDYYYDINKYSQMRPADKNIFLKSYENNEKKTIDFLKFEMELSKKLVPKVEKLSKRAIKFPWEVVFLSIFMFLILFDKLNVDLKTRGQHWRQ